MCPCCQCSSNHLIFMLLNLADGTATLHSMAQHGGIRFSFELFGQLVKYMVSAGQAAVDALVPTALVAYLQLEVEMFDFDASDEKDAAVRAAMATMCEVSFLLSMTTDHKLDQAALWTGVHAYIYTQCWNIPVPACQRHQPVPRLTKAMQQSSLP